MKKFLLTMALVVAGGAAFADPVEGIWQTQVDDGAYAYVKIAPCGAKICGTIDRTFKAEGEYKSENLGRKLVWDMAPDGANYYSGGTIWQPSSGKEYSSNMTLSGDSLKVKGCFGPICKKQTWSRVK